MSGHSKFANIKHKKEKNDAAKGKIFTILGREIAVAVKEGGPDPANNYKLAQVIAKAKANKILDYCGSCRFGCGFLSDQPQSAEKSAAKLCQCYAVKKIGIGVIYRIKVRYLTV